MGRKDGAAEAGRCPPAECARAARPAPGSSSRLGFALAPGIPSVRGENDAEIVEAGGCATVCCSMAVTVPEVEACTGTMRLSKPVSGWPFLTCPHPHQQFAGGAGVLAHWG